MEIAYYPHEFVVVILPYNQRFRTLTKVDLFCYSNGETLHHLIVFFGLSICRNSSPMGRFLPVHNSMRVKEENEMANSHDDKRNASGSDQEKSPGKDKQTAPGRDDKHADRQKDGKSAQDNKMGQRHS